MPLNIGRKHPTNINLRIARILTGKASLRTSAETDVNVIAENVQVTNDDKVTIEQSQVQTKTDLFADDRPFMDNDDPFKNRVPKRGIKKWALRFRKLKGYIELVIKSWTDKELPLFPRLKQIVTRKELTYGERLEIMESEERRRLEAFHRDASKRMGRLIINTISNLGLCDYHQEELKGHRKIRKTVAFDWIEFSPLVYRYHVDAKRLPWKINLFDLYQQPVVTTLSGSCGHPVRARNEIVQDQVTGLIYEVEIAATLGIPNKCSFSDLLPRVPEAAPTLSFLTGYTENKRPNWASLEDMPHLLGGGQTNGGKSNFMHVMICTFIARNTPEEVRLAMVDLKFDGIELHRYKGIKHMITEIPDVEDGIACNPKQAIAVLRWACQESERRGRLFKGEHIQNIKLWNRKHNTRRLAHVVVSIDELALLRTDREYGNEAYELIRVIASTARASGIHLIAFTQSSNKRIVDEMVKVNFPGRICFSVPDSSSSILFINNGDAVNLMPAGRAIFKHGTTHYMTQTPLIEPGEIDQIVRNAKSGVKTERLEAVHVSPEELIEWAIEFNNSSLAVKDAWNKFVQRLSRDDLLRTLRNMDGQFFDVGDRRYQVIPGTSNKPRTVVKVDLIGGADPEDLQNETQNTSIPAEIDEEVSA